MIKLIFSFLLTAILTILSSTFVFENSFAQENQFISPRHQWTQLPDPDNLICKDGLILLQKTNGVPACVTPSTYVKLIDRGFGKFDSSQIMKRPVMMNHLIHDMINESQLMHHWHAMMMNDPKIMQQTMSNMVLQLKEKPEFMANIMAPITTIPDLREQMIEYMKNHNHMMNSFQEHSGWMNSVHQPMVGSNMGKGVDTGMHGLTQCSWCPEMTPISAHKGFHQPKIMEDMMHHLWINENIRTQMHNFMLENHHHMGLMSDQMMGPMLGYIMDDPELRQQMIEMMLEHPEFMNSIRHEDKFSN
ncbi:MAG: hypothetical protein OES14_07275 [Nitrosopumilus sp.]|jgi:hypothetical protein|nr:hypothetical protein [Nitrosopumilus sp.]MDH3825578.1 hypothetical protein [Nitrosopumilus sp.]